jgi:DNA-binding beta-propeller fold protein YncE
MINLPTEIPHGVAVDQESQRIYVAVVTTEFGSAENGWVEQLQSDGTPTANSPFKAGPSSYFSGVAVNPVTHGIYAVRGFTETATVTLGEARRSSTQPACRSQRLPAAVVPAEPFSGLPASPSIPPAT